MKLSCDKCDVSMVRSISQELPDAQYHELAFNEAFSLMPENLCENENDSCPRYQAIYDAVGIVAVDIKSRISDKPIEQ